MTPDQFKQVLSTLKSLWPARFARAEPALLEAWRIALARHDANTVLDALQTFFNRQTARVAPVPGQIIARLPKDEKLVHDGDLHAWHSTQRQQWIKQPPNRRTEFEMLSPLEIANQAVRLMATAGWKGQVVGPPQRPEIRSLGRIPESKSPEHDAERAEGMMKLANALNISLSSQEEKDFQEVRKNLDQNLAQGLSVLKNATTQEESHTDAERNDRKTPPTSPSGGSLPDSSSEPQPSPADSSSSQTPEHTPPPHASLTPK